MTPAQKRDLLDAQLADAIAMAGVHFLKSIERAKQAGLTVDANVGTRFGGKTLGGNVDIHRCFNNGRAKKVMAEVLIHDDI